MTPWQRLKVRLHGDGRWLTVYERHRRDAARLVDRLARTDDPAIRAAVCLDISRELDRAARAADSPALRDVLGADHAEQLRGRAAVYRLRRATATFEAIRSGPGHDPDRNRPVPAAGADREPVTFWPWHRFDEDEA
ncbi:hypothetical protein J2S43_005966 [Catenuloplanes nepalensis]|uniref:Uncharacterized protein n=1 Tax=Catenuloplanes nepalensis TaxID=587533 RepID=A0ABT9N177_9ACTN|nr:hypothetical protein [Catenuloplanes nepalensis]MDP9797454.1 hypothetical protein [Catenuloplanes nepalensis]